MKETICSMCARMVIGRNGNYRCTECGIAVCRHCGLWNFPLCPNCKDARKKFVPEAKEK